MIQKLLAPAACALMLAAFAACAGGDGSTGDEPIGVNTPAGTKPPPTPAPGGDTGTLTPPPAPVPELDEAATPLADGLINAVVSSGLPYPINPRGLPLEGGAVQPACEQFVFAFGWQVTSPYPPDGVDIVFQIQRESGPVQVGQGVTGSSQTGCDDIEIVNRGDAPVFVDVHYIIGAVGQ